MLQALGRNIITGAFVIAGAPTRAHINIFVNTAVLNVFSLLWMNRALHLLNKVKPKVTKPEP